MKHLVRLALCAALALGACSHQAAPANNAGVAAAHDEDDDPSAPPKSAARITEDQAKATALGKVGGDVVASELEREHGHLIYSIEIRPTGQATGVKEVNVDAIDGSVVNIEDEQGGDDQDDGVDEHGEAD